MFLMNPNQLQQDYPSITITQLTRGYVITVYQPGRVVDVEAEGVPRIGRAPGDPNTANLAAIFPPYYGTGAPAPGGQATIIPAKVSTYSVPMDGGNEELLNMLRKVLEGKAP